MIGKFIALIGSRRGCGRRKSAKPRTVYANVLGRKRGRATAEINAVAGFLLHGIMRETEGR